MAILEFLLERAIDLMEEVMVEVLDCTNWKPYEGIAEGSGMSEKQWLVSDEGRIGLFKYPKYDPISQDTTYEHISEHLAHKLGVLVDVDTANVDIAIRKGRLGSLSYLITNEGEALSEGLNFIVGKHPHYNDRQLIDTSTGERYSIKHILEAVDGEPYC